MATFQEEQTQDKPKSHVIFSKKPLEIDSELWNSLLQMEPQAVTKLAMASLRKGVVSRDKEDSTVLLFFLKDVPIMQFFEKEFDTANLLQLITAMSYEHFKHGEEIQKQGERIPKKVYFIVSGQCSKEAVRTVDEFEDQNGKKTIRKENSNSQILAEKDSFGEESLNQSGDKITFATWNIRVLSDGLDCAVLNQELYFSLKRNLRQKREQARIRLIRGCHIFQDRLTTKQATALSKCFIVRLFSCRQAVYSEGEVPKSLFLVKSGRFRITKRVKFDYHFENTSQIASKRTSLSLKEQNVAVLSEGGCFGDEEILRHLNSRVYSVFCESAEGELLEIKANDFFKVLAEEFTEDDLRAIEKLPSIQHNWREQNVVSIVKIQRKYLEYLSEPPRQSDEAKDIFTRSISQMKQSRSINCEVVVGLSDVSLTPSPEKHAIKQEQQQYYDYYKGADVQFLNDEQFCSSNKIENIDSSSEDSRRTTTLRKDTTSQMTCRQENAVKQLSYVTYSDKRRNALGYLTDTKVVGNSPQTKTSITQNSIVIPLSRELKQVNSLDNNNNNNSNFSEIKNRKRNILFPKINGSPIRQLSANRDQTIIDQKHHQRNKLEDLMFFRLEKITKHPKNRSVSLSKSYFDESEKLSSSSINKRYQKTPLSNNSNISQVQSIYNYGNIKFQTPPRIAQNSKDQTIQASPRSSKEQRNNKQSPPAHFTFQEIDTEDLTRRGILKKKKNTNQGNSQQLYQEAERGKRILNNYIVNFSVRKKGSVGVDDSRRLFEDEIQNQLNDSKGFVIRGIHRSSSPEKFQKEHFSPLDAIQTDYQAIRNSNPIRKDKVFLKGLISQ